MSGNESAPTLRETFSAKKLKRDIPEEEKKEKYLAEKRRDIQNEVYEDLMRLDVTQKILEDKVRKADDIYGKVAFCFDKIYVTEIEKNDDYYFFLLETHSRINECFKNFYDFAVLEISNDASSKRSLAHVLRGLYAADGEPFKNLQNILYEKRDYNKEMIFQANKYLEKLGFEPVATTKIRTGTKKLLSDYAKSDF